jgi:3'(2'), 5'-bisphosphate nucleotidase
MLKHTLKDLLDIAIRASEAASYEILQVYNSDNFQAEAKGDKSPLTLADKKAHQAITSILKSTDLPILSEEGRDVPFDERKDWDYFWMVDPLDGTKEFIKRNGEFTVNIALIEKSRPVLGVVLVPVKGDIYYGAKGEGAFLIRQGSIQALPVHDDLDMSKTGLRVVASRSHLNEETEKFIGQLKEPEIVSSGSSLKFMLIASGEADVYPRFAPTMEWDTAASQAILEQVNCGVYQQDSKERLVYNKENLLNPYFLCI